MSDMANLYQGVTRASRTTVKICQIFFFTFFNFKNESLN